MDNRFKVKARAESNARKEAEELQVEGGEKVGDDEVDDDEVDEAAVFDDSDNEQDAIDAAILVAPSVVVLLREQFGQIRHWVYPCGTVCVTVAADHDAGLGLDASHEATDAFTVLRGWGDTQASYDVAMFKAQPRTTLVGFPHDAEATDEAVGLRARAILLSDIAWCEGDDLESSSGENNGDDELQRVPASDRLRVRRTPTDTAVTYADGGFATDGMRMRTVDTPAEAGGVSASTGVATAAPLDRNRWASAPELDQIVGELIGTREQVLACLRLQDQYRAHRRSLERCARAGMEGEATNQQVRGACLSGGSSSS